MPEIISVVVPVYNNRPTLDETCRQILEVHQSSFKDLELDLIFVNDGSTDESWQELLRLKNLYGDRISLLNLSRNFGQVGALYAGLNITRGDAVVCVSADLQDPIALIAKMVAYWRNDTEIVICYRENREDGFLLRIFSDVAYSIARVASAEIPKGGFDYWLMSRRVCKLLCTLKPRHNSLQGLLMSVGFNKAFIPYTRLKRTVGRSGYTFGKKLNTVIDLLIDSYLPIRFMSVFGAVTALCGLIYSLVMVYAWQAYQTQFAGWVPVIIVFMIIGGALMIMLGVIGEYLRRIYDNSKNFPLYIVETRSMSEGAENSK